MSREIRLKHQTDFEGKNTSKSQLMKITAAPVVKQEPEGFDSSTSIAKEFVLKNKLKLKKLGDSTGVNNRCSGC